MKRPPRAGFSLLELVLAVGLSVALVALLGFAIDLHLTKLDASRSTIERAQIARAILDRIAADLRATTSAPTQDVSEAMAAAEASAQFNVDEVDNAADAEASDSAEPEPDLYPAGLSGSAAELVIDCRRTLQSLTTLEAGATPTASLEATWSRVRYAMSADTASPGLARTEVGRDASVWSAEQGEAPATSLPIASEVLSLGLRYFDGSQFLEAWDMAEREALPLAVEVTIELAPLEEEDDTSVSEILRTARTYRRLVRLTSAESDNGGAPVSSDDSTAAESI